MSEKVKMTEEQAYQLVKVIFSANCATFPSAMSELKKAGYILPDPVEEAEKEYKDWDTCGDKNGFPKWELEGIVKSLYGAIQLMKPYYEKHKGGRDDNMD